MDMKQFLNNRLIISLLCLTLFSTNVRAEVERPYVYTLSLSYHNKLNWGEDDNGNKSTKDGYRCPSRPVSIVITQADGVQIPHVDKNEILSYSIYDEEETCLATFTNEADFVDFVFSTTGEVEIRIELADYYLCGWLQL